jgi:hypothetical protein
MANEYDLGSKVKIRTEFTDADTGDPVDPGTVTVKIKKPDGVIVSHVYPSNVVKDDTGIYHLDLDITAHGRWFYRWEGSGINAGASESYFQVRESEFD